MKKRLLSVLIMFTLILAFPVQTFACTAIYVGSDLTEDGSTIFGRVEDFYSADWPKLYSAIPAGTHKAGDVYNGCYGFTWTFTHDSYSYTAFCDDISQGVCPDCGGTHVHTPYQAGGTNEKGLSVTATETLMENTSIKDADPYPETGIEEAEITTLLLSEAASAREAVELLASVFDDAGAYGAGSVLIGDAKETWYIESLSGFQYAAVKLNAGMLFVVPNISVIGLIDLDDTENIIASGNLIETAVTAGTFVGDKDENIIDFSASYAVNYSDSSYSRLSAGLNYLNAGNNYPEHMEEADIESTSYSISNLDADGNLVMPYTNIEADRPMGISDVIGYFKTSPIGKARNAETHIFQISDDSPTGTVEWVAMANSRYSAFVPYYPMLTTDVYPAYEKGSSLAEYVDEEPAEGTYFPSDDRFVLYPDGWQDSFYWTFAVLNHLAEADENKAAHIAEAMDNLQTELYGEWEKERSAVAEAGEGAASLATEGSAGMAELAYKAARQLYLEYVPENSVRDAGTDQVPASGETEIEETETSETETAETETSESQTGEAETEVSGGLSPVLLTAFLVAAACILLYFFKRK